MLLELKLQSRNLLPCLLGQQSISPEGDFFLLALSFNFDVRAERTLILHRPPPDICDVVTCPPRLLLPKRDTVDIEKHDSCLL